MSHLDKKSLSEADIRTKFITPAIERARWNLIAQVREQVYFTDGRVISSNAPTIPPLTE